MLLLTFFVTIGLVLAEIPYAEYVLTPKSRTLRPSSAYNVNGSVPNAGAVFAGDNKETVFVGPSAVTYDFGRNVAGIVSFNVTEAAQGAWIGISFTESSLWINSDGCDATADAGLASRLLFCARSQVRVLALVFNFLSEVHDLNDLTLTWVPTAN